MLTISTIKDLYFAKDGIPISVLSNNSQNTNHYARIEFFLTYPSISITHPITNYTAEFDIKKIIEIEFEKEFNIQTNGISKKSIISTVDIRIYEIFNEEIIYTSDIYQINAIMGSEKNFISNSPFLSNYNNRIINKSEDLLLFILINSNSRKKIRLRFFDKDLNIITTKEFNTDPEQQIETYNLFYSHLDYSSGTYKIEVYVEGYTNVFNFYIEDLKVIDIEEFLFRNSYGAYDKICLNAHTQKENKYDFELFVNQNKIKKTNTAYTDTTEKYAFALNEQFENETKAIELLKELYLSEEVYIVNAGKTTEQVIITDKEQITKDTMTNNYVFKISYQKIEKNA